MPLLNGARIVVTTARLTFALPPVFRRLRP
jgi:hypothetical protein